MYCTYLKGRAGPLPLPKKLACRQVFGTCASYHDLHLQVYKYATATHACVKKTGQRRPSVGRVE